MAVASWVTTLRDLGVPTVAGAVIGAVIGAVAQRLGRNVMHQQAIDLLILGEERAAASETETALHALECRALQGTEAAGTLRHDWMDRVQPRAKHINDPELMRRVELVGGVLLFAHQVGDKTHWRYAVAECTEDARAGLSAYLRRESLPPARFPNAEVLRGWASEGFGSLFDRLNHNLADGVRVK